MLVQIAAFGGIDQGGIGRDTFMLKDDGKQQGFVFTVAEAAGKDIRGRVGPVGILADLQAEVPDIVLDEPGSEIGENVLVAGGGLLPFRDLVEQGRRKVNW